MTQEDNTTVEDSKGEEGNTSELVQWNVFFWKLIRSLAIIVAGTTVIYLVCRWLIY